MEKVKGVKHFRLSIMKTATFLTCFVDQELPNFNFINVQSYHQCILQHRKSLGCIMHMFNIHNKYHCFKEFKHIATSSHFFNWLVTLIGLSQKQVTVLLEILGMKFI